VNHQGTDFYKPIYIALGTNLGERTANLGNAIRFLAPQVDVIAESPIYQTSPWGYEDQPDFLNQVLSVQTHLAPVDLLEYLQEIEVRIGRQPTFRYGPRIIDLDILFFADIIFNVPGLQIPHPRLHERAFVLVPLFDLDPEFRHPVMKSTIRELLLNLDVSNITRFETA
jgi:2-amino-4-hydroxy-6-hydroxymethyldihydropteridine diphosphokinase